MLAFIIYTLAYLILYKPVAVAFYMMINVD